VTFGRFQLSHGGWLASSCGVCSKDWIRTTGNRCRTIGPGVREIRIHIAGAHRVFYVASRPEAIYVLHAFEKKTPKTSAHHLRVGRDRFRALQKLGQKHGKEKRG
jgi:phage-related protein